MVYFIEQEGTNLVKIGCAKDVRQRFLQLQTSSPQKLILRGYINGSFKEEKELHKKFKGYLHGGEWYEFTRDIEEYININCIMDLNDEITGRYNVENYKEIKIKNLYTGEINIVYKNDIDYILSMNLNSNEKLTYYGVREFMKKENNCVILNNNVPSMIELSSFIGLNEKTIRNSLKTLENKKLIKLVQCGHRKAIYINPKYYMFARDIGDDIKNLFKEN